MIIQQQAGHKTVGVIGTGLATFMQNQLWQGAMQAAREHGTRLVYYPTINLSSTPPFAPQSKVLFDLIDARYIDGLLVWYAGIEEGVGVQDGEAVLERYTEIPLVTIGGKLKHYPDLSIDNYQGVYSLVEHLIQIHHRRQIAIVRGPVGHPDADERYKGYTEALHAHRLPLNPEYVEQSLFELSSAAVMTESAVARWLQEKRLAIDAIVAASDYIALGVIKAVEARGRRVPEDIAVVGFDGVADSQASIPTVTTVYQSFYELGRRGMEMLLTLMDGQPLPARSVMSAPVVFRESCGCAAKSLSLSKAASVNQAAPGGKVPPPSRKNLPDDLITAAQEMNVPLTQLENLAGLFRSDLGSQTSHQFLSALRQSLIEAQKVHFDAITWQNAISALRRQALSAANGDIGVRGETLFDQARVLVTEIHQRAYIRQQIEARQQIENLLRASETLLSSFGEHLFADTLYARLPELGFKSFYLLLYEDPHRPALWSRLFLACEDGRRLELPPGGLRFPTGRLIPESVHPAHPAAPIVVEPLYFSDEQQGLLVLEVGPREGSLYENLRAQISSALQGSRLLQEVLTRTHQLESANGELEAFSYSVSHDLRAPLRAIDGFSRRLTEEYEAALPQEAQRLLGRIQHNAERMGDLINDLLEFSRVGHQALNEEDTDMNQLVQEVLDDLRADNQLKQAEIAVEPLPPCRADRALLKQVWINLISNAVKYTSRRVHPRIEIRHVTRPPGAAYLVKDNGVGFDMRYADKLFGVFQRLHGPDEYEGTGIGLALVHRIITRHGGTVWGEAELGKGATFYFTI